MKTRFRTLLLAGAASLAMSGAALAQTTVNGAPSTIGGVMKIVCTDSNNAAAQPCFVALSSGGQAVSTTNRFPVNADGSTVTANQGAAGAGEWLVRDGTDGPGTNPGTGARGWLSGLYAKQAAAVSTGSTSTTAQPVQGAGAAATPLTGGAIYNTTPPTLTNGALGALQLDVNGNLKTLTTLNGGVATVLAGGNFPLGVGGAAGGLGAVVRLPSSGVGTNAQLVKSTPGRVYKVTGYNAASSIRWLHFYNVTTAPTPGTTTVFFTLPLPPGAYSFDAADIGYSFSNGIAYSVTAGAGDTDATNTAAGDILQQNVWVQ